MLEGTAEQARLAEGKAKRANTKADKLLNKLDNDLIPKFESIRAGTVGGLENLTRISKCINISLIVGNVFILLYLSLFCLQNCVILFFITYLILIVICFNVTFIIVLPLETNMQLFFTNFNLRQLLQLF